MQVSVIGLGYVGLVTAACVADWGHDVVGVDTNASRLNALRAERLPFFEPGLVELVRRGLHSRRLQLREEPESAVRDAQVVIIAVGTHDGNGGWQTTTVLSALHAVVPHLAADATLVIRSTLPPQFIRDLREIVGTMRAAAQRSPVPILLNPEFTREGSAVEDFMNPSRVVIGVSHDPAGRGVRLVQTLYQAVTAPVLVMPAINASIAKLGSNLFLATKISFANELASICDAFGAEVDGVIGAMALDPRIGAAFLGPGVGFGGSCLPHQVTMTVRDAQAAGIGTPLLSAVDLVNHRQRSAMVDKVSELLDGDLDGRRIGLLGLTFKPDTDDMRDAPSLSIARELIDRGASVIAYDPQPTARRHAQAALPALRIAERVEDAMAGAEALALVTEWPEFRVIDWSTARLLVRRAIVVDGRNALSPTAVTDAGFTYVGFGRGVSYPTPIHAEDRFSDQALDGEEDDRARHVAEAAEAYEIAQ